MSRCGIGLGGMAFGSLMAKDAGPASRGAHFPARAKNVIFLFMAGGPSQLDMFEHKPALTQWNGKPIPESFVKGKRFAFMDSSHRSELLGSRRSFQQHGQSGAWVSDLLPHMAGIVDELAFVTTCKTDLFNHAPAKLFMNTGSGFFGRPSMGAWVTYGLGSESNDLPGFVVLQSGPRGPQLTDIHGESQATLDLYGIKDVKESSYARNCLLARRLVERGVRFVQLYDTNWDHHGGPTENLEKHLPLKCRDIDQASAALVKDLGQRGLLEDTIVIWGGEFGRTPITAASGATVHAGDGTTSTDYGTLTFTPASGSGSFNFQAGSSTVLDLNPGGSSDKLVFTGTGTNTLLFNGNVTVRVDGFSPTGPQVFDLLDWSGLSAAPTFASRFLASSYSGLISGNGDDSLGFDLPNVSGSGYAWDISSFTTNGSIALVAVVPEPSRALLILLSVGGLLLRRQRSLTLPSA